MKFDKNIKIKLKTLTQICKIQKIMAKNLKNSSLSPSQYHHLDVHILSTKVFLTVTFLIICTQKNK